MIESFYINMELYSLSAQKYQIGRIHTMKKWLIALTFCLAICVCACFAMADPAPNAVWEVTGVTEDLTTHDSIRISVTVNGANRVELYTCDANGNLIYGIHEKKGSTCTASWATDTGGEYWFKAIAYFGEEEYGFIYSDQPICVNSSEDPLPVPTVTISNTFAVAGGYAIDQGQNITFSFTENPALFDQNSGYLPEHEDVWYNAYLYRMNGENQPVQLIGEPMGKINAGTEYSFGTHELIGGETYCISVDIQQRGYDGVAVNAPFLVNPNQEFVLRGDEQNITIDANGVISAPMHQWIPFRVTAPNAGQIRAYCLDAPLQEGEDLPEGIEPFEDIWTNGSPVSDFQWVTNTLPKNGNEYIFDDYTKYFYVLIDYDNDISRLIGGLQLDVQVNETTMQPVGFTVVDGTLVNDRYEVEVARDGRVFVDVNNYYLDANNNPVYTTADYYGVYIGEDTHDDTNWLADSHWVKVAEQPENTENYGTTRVPLTVPRCLPKEYTAHVFAIKFGEPQLDLGDIQITVTGDDNECPFILSMGNEFVSGDPLRVFAHYTDPYNLNGWMTIRIVNVDDPDDVVFADTQGYKDFWDDTSACWHEGTFRVEAEIWYWDPIVGNKIYESYPNAGIITVTADDVNKDRIAVHDPLIRKPNEEDPVGEPVWQSLTKTSIKAGEDLSLKIMRPDNADFYEVQIWYYKPEWDSDIVLFEGYELTDEEIIINIDKNSIPEANPMNSTEIFIGVHGMGYNKNDKGRIWDYPVMPETEAGEVTLTVSGLDANNTIPVNKDFSLTVTDESNTPDETRQIKMVCVFSNYGFTCYHGPDNDGVFRDSISFEDEGQYPVFALVSFDEMPEDFDWWQNGDQVTWYATNTVEVTATSIGQVGEFSFTLDDSIDVQNGSATVERGRIINVTYTPADYATNYWIDIDRYEDEWGWGWIDHVADLHVEDPADPNAAMTAVIPTARLEAGKYRIRAVANGEGYLRRETEDLELNITEPESPGIIFNVDVPADENGDRSIITCEDYLLTVYAPGADWVDVIFDCESYDFERDEGWYNSWHGDSVSTTCSYSDTGTYTLVARGWYPAYDDTGDPIWEEDEDGEICLDDEGNPIQIHNPDVSEPIELTVTATGGSVTITKPEGLPAYIIAGTEDDLVFTVAKPGQADRYLIDVWYDAPDGGLCWDDDIADESRTVAIPAEDIPQFQTWMHVRVRGWGFNKEAADETWDIPVIPAVDSNVTLSLEGLGQDNEILVNTNATLRVEKSEDEEREIQTICVFDGRGEWKHEGPDRDGAYERDISFDDEGTYAVYAKVTFDTVPDNFDWDNNEDPREWHYTNTVLVTVEKNGDVGEVRFSVDCNINDQYGYAEAERGQIITVTYEPAQNATHYWIDVEKYDEDQNRWQWIDHTADLFVDDPEDESTVWTATMMTAEYDADHSYRIRATADAEGYIRNWSDELDLEITDPGTGGIIFNVDVPEVNGIRNIPTSKDYGLSVYASGADRIDVFFDFDHYDFERNEGWFDNWDGDSIAVTRQYGDSGTYTLVARAWYPKYDDDTGEPIWEVDEDGTICLDDEGNPIQAHYYDDSNPIVLTVTASGGDVVLTRPEGLPYYIMAGTQSSVTFTVNQPENAEYYSIDVWYDAPDGGGLYYDGSITGGSCTVTVAADRIPDFETRMHVKVRGWGYNVESCERTWDIPVVPTASDIVSLTITGPDAKNTLPINTDATLRVEKAQNVQDEIRTVYIYDGYGYRNHEGPDEDGSYERNISFGDVGTFAVYAMVTFDTVDDGWDWDDGDPRTWYATNLITVDVTKAGDLGPFSYELDRTEATRGDMITVTYTPDDETDFDVHYWLDIGQYDGYGNWHDESNEAHLNSTNGGTATFATAQLAEGTYYLRARSDAPGYAGWSPETELTISVTEPEDGGIFFNVNVPLDEQRHGTVITSEDIRMSAYAPGARFIEVLFDYDHFNFAYHEGWWNEWNGNSFSAGHQYDQTGEYKMVARALCPAYDGITGDPIWEKDEQGKIRTDDEGNNIRAYCWIESDPILLTVTATGENVIVTRPDNLPAYIPLGTTNNLEFTVTKPENADQYRIEVWYDNPYTKLYEDNDLNGSSRPVTIRADRLPQEEKQLRVKVRGWGYNKEADEKTWNIPVVPEDSEIVTLTMTGLGEANTLPVNTDATLRVETASGVEDEIKTVYVYGGYGYWDHEGSDGDGAYERNISFGDEGTFAVYAMVTFDEWDGNGEDNREWVCTNVVTVNVTKTGDLGPFSYTTDKTDVTRGELITVTFTPEDETGFDVHYWVDIGRYNENGEWYYLSNEAHVNSTNGGTATILTAWMEAGTYYLRARSNTPGYVGWEPENDIAITVTEPENNGFIFTVDVPLDANRHGTVHTSEDIRMSAYAPEASSIEVLFDYDHFNFEDHEGWRDDWDGDFFRTSHQYGNSGEYKMVARAWCPAYDEVTGNPIWEKDEQGNFLKDDEGNNIPEYHWIESDPIVLNVIATGGSVTVAKPEGLPAYIMAGTNEDLTFTVEQPENAEYYEINVWCDGPDGVQYADNDIEDESRTVTIPSGELPHEENLIRVRVRGWGYNVESAEETWNIPVVPTASNKVTLTMTGLGEENTLPVNTDATLRVEKTQNEERSIQTVCVFGGYDHWQHEGPDEDGAYEHGISFGEARTFTVYAMVTFDQWNGEGEDTRTWYATNVITINVTKAGDLRPFSYELDSTEVTRGDMITVTYTPETETDFDVHYWVDIGRYYGNSDWRCEWNEAHVNSTNGGTATIPTARLEEGTYYLRARSNAPGYVGWDPDEELAISVTEPENGGIIFNVDVPLDENRHGTIPTSEDIRMSAYAPGANWIEVLFDYDHFDFTHNEGWSNDWGGDSFSAGHQYGNSGEYKMVARAWYWDDDNDTYYCEESDPIELTVTSTGGNVVVTRPEDLPAYIGAGTYEDLTFTVSKPENADEYFIDVWYDNPDGGLYHADGITDDSRIVTIEGDRLQWAENWINVKVHGSGYNLEADEQTWRIPIIPADENVATLTLEGLGEGNTLPVNKDARLTITNDAEGWGEIQTVCVFGGYGFRDHDGVDGDGVYRSNISFGDEETFVVYALVTFDPWDGEGEDTRTWYATNAVTVNVTARGQANPFTIGLSSAQVNRGEKIRVTINTPEGEGVDPDYNPDHYGFNLRDMDDPDWRWITPNSIAEINTTNLRPGTYQICAYGNAEGLTRYETPWETITVNNPEMGNERIRFRVNGGTEDVTAQIAENLEVSVIAPGAIRVGFFEDGNPWHEENGRYCWADSCDSWYINDLYWMFGNDVGTHELKAAALFDEDEGWVLSEPIHVTITKTGDLAFDLENVPPYFTENAAESFTIDLPDHADWMRIRAYRAWTGDNGQPWRAALLFDEPELSDDYTVSIAGSSLIAGEQIWIEMEAFGLGYASDHEEKHIPVLPEPAAGGATLAFENATPDENGVVNVLLNQELEIALVPDDGETLSAVRFFDGKGFWEDYQGEEINRWNHSDWFRTGEGEDGAFHVRFNYDWREDVGLHTVFVYYRLEGGDNMSMAGPIVVNVSALGTVGAYDFVPNQETTVTVTRGEMVTFEFTAAQNAEYYWLDAISGEGDDWHSWDPDRTSNGTKVTLFTAELPAGEYEIWGRAGRDGWIWTESDSCVKLIVTEQNADWVSMIIKDEVLTNENVHWSAFAPDAVAIDVKGYVLNGNNDKEYFFEAGNQDWSDTTYINGECCITGHAGTAYVDVTVWYADSDPRTDTTPITVSAPNGDLSAPRYSGIPWYAGQDLNITITPDQNTEWYTIDDVLDGYGTSCYRTPEGRTETGAKTLNVSWNQIGNGYISITIHQHGVGYNDSHTTVYIRPIDTTGLITLPAALSTIEEGAFEDNGAITHVIIPDGVTSIGDRAFCNCSRLLTVEIQSRDISFGTNAFDAGITIYGYSGSTAESYAQANGISFVGID